MSLCRFPAPTRLPDDVITVLIGRVPTAYIDAAAPESTVIYDHATSLASIAEGRSPDFLEEFIPAAFTSSLPWICLFPVRSPLLRLSPCHAAFW